MLQVVPTGEPDDWVKKQNLLPAGKPSAAGILLFSDEPQSGTPQTFGDKNLSLQDQGR
jgi:ATP-dependent DNA helicase RecG